jgi:UDP-2,3-diacylglucosamine hydrolase
MSRTLFVSDVHLRPNAPEANAPFFRFLKEECGTLYIVGDLFDHWVGPKHLESSDYATELSALRRKSERTKIYFIKGNRDYLVEERFARKTGITVLGDRARVELGGRTLILAHGDFIYNTNPKYTAYRTIMRSKPVEDLWLQVPLLVGRTITRGFRKVSPRTTPPHAWTREELVDRARPVLDQDAEVLITGHLHLPTHLTFEAQGKKREVYILGDWCGGTQDYLDHDGREFQFLRWE